MNKKLALVLIALLCFSLLAHAIKISGDQFENLTPSSSSSSTTASGVKVIEGNPFGETGFEETSTPVTPNKPQECIECDSILKCFACLDKWFVARVFR